MSASEPLFAYYPLTHFDFVKSTFGHTLGWLVEGILDEDKLDSALQRIAEKWPTLAGRVDRDGDSYRIKVPLSGFPEGYVSFVLTSNDSPIPISNLVELPLPLFSDTLPASLFISPSAPKNTQLWYDGSVPFTFWHLTHFRHVGEEYTCIGLTFSHGVFDGMGISLIIQTLEAETLGRPWSFSPPQLLPGQNQNPFQLALEKSAAVPSSETTVYPYFNALGLWRALTTAFWYGWQACWHKVHSRAIMIPSGVCEKLATDARKALALEGKENVRLSTGDILAAWFLKIIYSTELDPKRRVALSNQMNLRNIFELDKSYIQNCFMALPYPLFTISELQAFSLADLASKPSTAKSSASLTHAVTAHRRMGCFVEDLRAGTKVCVGPIAEGADESLVMTNMVNGRALDIDWTGLGGGKTIFRYKSNRTPSSIPLSNAITIVGKLSDGRVALEAVLNKKRMRLLEEEIMRLSLNIEN